MIPYGCGCVYCAAEQGRTDGTSGVCIAEPLGECPDVSIPQAVNQIDWYQRQIAELGDINRALELENRGLRGALDTARGELATAKALGSRTGW